LKKILFLVSLFLFLFSCSSKKKEIKKIIKPTPPKEIYEFGYKLSDYKVINDTVKKGESFGVILDRNHVGYPKINKIAITVKDTFDVRRIRAGKPYTILASKDSLEQAQVFIYKHNKISATVIHFSDSTITAYVHYKKIKLVEKQAFGVINTNLSNTMDSLRLSANLTYAMADIYAWTLDFYKLQKGDEFKFVYQEKFIDDTIFAGYGHIKSAVFRHNKRDLYAFRFMADSVKQFIDYYDEEGNMLRSQFLKSPIKFKYRISSRFDLNRRIKFYGYRRKPHRGTDFAAKIGTPIIATASGTVTESTRRGGNGKFVKIKHNSTYSTQYLHMKNQKVRKGQYVKQGDVIGWIGMTGNTGGPHVCYRFWKHGKEVDPRKEKLPAAKPLKKSIKPQYLEYIKPLKKQLNTFGFTSNETSTAPVKDTIK